MRFHGSIINIERVVEFSGKVSRGGGTSPDARRRALELAFTAAHATKAYIDDLRENRIARDRERELRLVEAWQAAAMHMPMSDADLRGRMLQKADYWTRPGQWTDEQVEHARISIDRVYNELRTLHLNTE